MSELAMLTPEERELVLGEWNETAAPYPQERCLHELFEEQVDRTPDAIAVVSGDQQRTYRELDDDANRLANLLRRRGARPEVLVGVSVERGMPMVIALLGVLKSGAAYVPLDPEYPAARLGFMLEDTQAPLVVVQGQSSLADLLFPEQIIDLDLEAEALAAEAASRPDSGADPRNLAYVMYTSGSTGRPKGVMVEHRSVVNLGWSLSGLVELSATDRLLAVTTYAFDISVFELLIALTCGARVIVARDPRDAQALLALLAEQEVTIMQATPATWRLLIAAGWSGNGMRVISGGEALPGRLAAELAARASVVWNLYGPTETTIWSSAWRYQPGAEISIGRPLANTQLYILDPDRLQPVPLGSPGELFIAGDGVARGYLHRPALTADRFVPNPFAQGTRMYRTGDQARYHADGNIEYLGRTDNQVKLRGHRIELGEIEHVLLEHPAVQECVVELVDEEGSGEGIRAWVVTLGREPAEANLWDWASQRLPRFMVPASITLLSRLPLTASGKLDRQALPATTTPASGTDATQTSTEKRVASLFAGVVRLSSVGRNDDFFEIGGHSLLAVELSAEVLREFGIAVPLSVLFSHPTVFELAAEIDRLSGT
jgi:amino acid adenylation domain-containing protein